MGEVNTPNFKDFSCQTLGIWDMERCQGVPTIHLDFSFSSHSHHLLTKPFPRKITIVWHSPSVPTEVSSLSQRNLPNKLQQTCCAIFPQPIQMFGFYFSLFPVKNHSQKCGFKRMSVSLPAPHLIFYLCVSPALPFGACVWCSAEQNLQTQHTVFALRTDTKWLSTGNCSFPWTFGWPFAPSLKKMTHPPSEWSDPMWLNPSQLWHFHAVTTGFLLSTGPTVLCTLVEQVFCGSCPYSSNIFCIFIHLWCCSCAGHQSCVGFRIAQTWDFKQLCSSNSDLEHFRSFKDIKCFESLTWFIVNKLPAPLSFLKRETTSFHEYSWFESNRNGTGRKTVTLISRVRLLVLSEYCPEYLSF